MSALALFEGKELRVYRFRGRPCMLAKDVGEALGYTPDGFSRTLRSWEAELKVDSDLSVLRGDDLREFFGGSDAPVDNAGGRISQLTVLFEPALYLVCIKTEKPLGVKLRRFLSDEVLPKLSRGETIAPSAPSIARPEMGELERARAVKLANIPLLCQALEAITDTGWFDERFAKDFLQREIQDATVRLLPAANQYPVNLEIFLEGKGARGKVAHDLASPFGKVVRARYFAVHGKNPPRKQEPGRAHTQYSYYDEDRKIIEEAFATFALSHPEVFAASLSTRRAG